MVSNEFVDISTHYMAILEYFHKYQDERRTPLAAQVEFRTLLAAVCVSRDLSGFRNSQRPDVCTLGRFGTIRAEGQSNEKRAYERILTFGTAQSNTPIITELIFQFVLCGTMQEMICTDPTSMHLTGNGILMFMHHIPYYITRSCPEPCGPLEWTAFHTIKSIVTLCL